MALLLEILAPALEQLIDIVDRVEADVVTANDDGWVEGKARNKSSKLVAVENVCRVLRKPKVIHFLKVVQYYVQVSLVDVLDVEKGCT